MTKKNTNTKRIFRLSLLTGTIASLFFVPWPLVKAWIFPLPDTVQEQVNEAIGHGFDGMIVYIDVSGKPPAFYAGGWHDRENKVPAYPQALFKIASISKLYTAVAVSKLINDRRLSLDSTLADYLPELEGRIENTKKITLKMMLQHRSGIPNLTDAPNFWKNPPGNNSEALERVLDLPAGFEPDTDYEYSNTNYLLLSEIMDKVLGYDHFQFIREEILNRLNLNSTFVSIYYVNIDDLMGGYYIGIKENIKTTDYG